MSQTLMEKILRREAKLAVIGQGYVGFPLAVAFAQAGMQVRGLDVDRSPVEDLNASRLFTRDVPTAAFAKLRQSGAYVATTEFGELANSDLTIICVPTPLRKRSIEVSDDELDAADCLLILTDHPDFDLHAIAARTKLIVDTRNATWQTNTCDAEVIRL